MNKTFKEEKKTPKFKAVGDKPPKFKAGDKKDDPISMYLNDVFTVPANLAGLPAISVPAGHDKKKLPLGLQFIGKAFNEQTILNLSLAIQKRANFKRHISEWWK